MKYVKALFTLVGLFFNGLTVFAQTLKTVDSVEAKYQSCLDKGEFMLGCSQTFYFQIDSLLNVRYKRLRSQCDSIQKENLKAEQLEWLVKRDKEFRTNKNRVHKNARKESYALGQDEIMFLTHANAAYVTDRVIELINAQPQNYSADQFKIIATGFYSLNSKTVIKNGDTFGYFGDIKVKEIGSDKIAIRLFVCKGARSYNSGTLSDTLVLAGNKAFYATEYDPSCKLVFTFYNRGIMVEQFADNPNFACGFGMAVDAFGFYKKLSSKIPTDKELIEN